MAPQIIGSYQGKPIYAGSDSEVSTQMFGTAPESNVINSNSIKPIEPIKLVKPENKSVDYTSTINQVASDLSTQDTIAKRDYEAKLAEAKGKSQEIANLQLLLGDKAGDTALTYEKKGVNKIYNRIAELNAEASNLQREAQAIPIQIQQESTGQGVTDAGVAPIQASRLRENALKALSLGQQASMANAQYDKAKNYADQIINTKYDSIVADINAKLTNLASLEKYELTPAQEKAKETSIRTLEYQKEVENDKKNTQLKNNELLINAASFGAPQNVQMKAKEIADKGGSTVEVATALGNYAGNFFQNQALQIELRNKKIADLTANGVGVLPVGNVTKDLGITVDDYMRGIAGTESSGSRDAYGGTDPYKVLSGQKTISEFNAMSQKEKENTAYGKYQVMGFNIPEWTKEAFGKAMTIQEFLNSPEKQDALIRYQAEKEYSKYGNWDDVASIWFSGKPAANNVRSDKFGTNVPAYITKYRKNMGISTSGATVGVSAEAKAYSDAIDKGEYKDINAIPEKYQTEVTKYRSARPAQANPAQIEILKTQLNNINSGMNLIGGFAGLGGANIAGANFLGRTDLGTFFSGDKATALGYIDNILSGATLEQLIKAKEAGATFGALSNQELGLLERSASVLNKWAIRDPDTNELQGFKVPDEKVIEELNKIKEKLTKGIGGSIINENTSVADDIYDMQARVTSSTPKYVLFNN